MMQLNNTLKLNLRRNMETRLVDGSDKVAPHMQPPKRKSNKYFGNDLSMLTIKEERKKKSVCCDPIAVNVTEDSILQKIGIAKLSAAENCKCKRESAVCLCLSLGETHDLNSN